MKILFLDDHDGIAEMLSDGLRNFGYETFYCKNPKEALKKVDEILPDIIFSDFIMPDMNGFEFCREVKNTHPNVPLFLLSSYAQKMSEVKDCGAIECLEKPYSYKEIDKKIKEYFQ